MKGLNRSLPTSIEAVFSLRAQYVRNGRACGENWGGDSGNSILGGLIAVKKIL